MTGRTCTRCGETKPATREFFGSTPSGTLRGYCRTCMNKASRDYEAQNKDGRRKRDSKRAQAGVDARKPFDIHTKHTLYRKQGGVCPCCMQIIAHPDDGQVDHMTPLARGG